MNPDPISPVCPHPPAARRLAPPILLCLTFLLLTWPVILTGAQGTSEAYDQRAFHEVVIRAMAGQWPNVDLVNYDSATTPGYHLVMAAAAAIISERTLVLQLLSSLFGLALLLAVYRTAARLTGAWPAVALTLPLLASSYFLGGSIWLTTDNAGKLFLVLALGGSAMLAPSAARLARWGLYATFAVLVRQILLWVVAPIALAALLASPMSRILPPLFRLPRQPPHRWRDFLLPLPLVLAPFVVVAFFFYIWRGSVPPGYVSQHASGSNPAVIPLALALIGVYGIFFLPFFAGSDLKRILADRLVWLAATSALLLSLAFVTSFDKAAGRSGGTLWWLVGHLPTIAGRTILFPPLAVLGAIVTVCAWRAACAAGRSRAAAILLLSLLGWLLAQLVNSKAWQRYCEPIVLIQFIWLAALAVPPSLRAATPALRRGWIGPLLLALLLLAVSAYTLYYGAYLDLIHPAPEP